MAFSLAKDLVFFTFFFEAMLIPLYFLINIWGGHQKRKGRLYVHHLHGCRLNPHGSRCAGTLLFRQ